MRNPSRIAGGRVQRNPWAWHTGKYTHSHKGKQIRQGQPLRTGGRILLTNVRRFPLGSRLKANEHGNGRQRAQWRRAEHLRQYLRDRIAIIPVLRKLVPFLIQPPAVLSGKSYPGKGRW